MPRKPETREVVFTEHARERAQARRVPEAECERLIKRGPAWQSDGVGQFGDPKWIATGVFDGRSIGVVFVEARAGFIEVLEVVTVTSSSRGR